MDGRLEAWAASGAMALTGRPDDEPLGPPGPLVDGLRGVARALAAATDRFGARVDVDPLALLGERAAIAGLTRHGAISCGGGTRLIRAADGIVAVALARAEDRELVPAWLELSPEDVVGGDADRGVDPADDRIWDTIATSARHHPAAWLESRAALVGLAAASCPPAPSSPTPSPPPRDGEWPIRIEPAGPAARTYDATDALVVDLSALWAGPLCGRLLAGAGARVVKVESTTRPDGARSGPAAFFDLLNADKASVALDLTSAAGREQLRRLLLVADVVIESSRPRALQQLGIDASELLALDGGPAVWVSITGWGRRGSHAHRIAYGDVAAVAGGLVVHDDRGACFCADAVADPMTGLVAAVAALDALASGRRALLDVAMVAVASRWCGPQVPVPASGGPAAAPPEAPEPPRRARALGADNATVLRELPR